jgi:phage terminase small subunit
MNDAKADLKIRADAAKALLPFVHAKKGEVGAGKKEQAVDAARKAAGKFSAAAPPKLAAVGGKKVG